MTTERLADLSLATVWVGAATGGGCYCIGVPCGWAFGVMFLGLAVLGPSAVVLIGARLRRKRGGTDARNIP